MANLICSIGNYRCCVVNFSCCLLCSIYRASRKHRSHRIHLSKLHFAVRRAMT
jgi:hypothetical protein